MRNHLIIPVVLMMLLCLSAKAEEVGFPTPRSPAKPDVEQPAAKHRDTKAQNGEALGEEEQRIYQSACPAVLNGTVVAKLLPPISEGQCGERSPLEVTEIAGVKLTSKAVLNCRMATTVAEWIADANATAKAVLKTKVISIVSSTTYQCRRRNNAPTGKISEHGFANALDIIGFKFEDAKEITLLEDWPLPQKAEAEENSKGKLEPEATPELEFLKTIRDQACKRFTTVLGPESNPLHADHFHFDLGCHGKTCTYKICE